MNTPSGFLSHPTDAFASLQRGQFSVHEEFRPTIEVAESFDTVDKLFNAIDQSRGEDVLRVHPVSREQFEDIHNKRDSIGRKFRFFYLEEIKLLIVTIPSGPHEVVRAKVHDKIIVSQLDQMSLEPELEGRLAQEHTYQGGELSGSGEGDDSFVPIFPRPDKDAWPTLVLEVGYSQSFREMRAKTQVWFRRSNFEVKIVLVIKLTRQDRSMIIEKWKVLPHPPLAHPAATASSAAPGPGPLEPQCVHTVKVELPGENQHMNLQAYPVTSGDLRLEFEDLFLRNPGPNEGDIVIGHQHLRCVATRGFSLMGQ